MSIYALILLHSNKTLRGGAYLDSLSLPNLAHFFEDLPFPKQVESISMHGLSTYLFLLPEVSVVNTPPTSTSQLMLITTQL